jgi:hypothetical protein
MLEALDLDLRLREQRRDHQDQPRRAARTLVS